MYSAERKHCVTSENIFQIFETTQNNMTTFSVMHLEKWGTNIRFVSTKFETSMSYLISYNVTFVCLYVLFYAFTKYSGDNSLRFSITVFHKRCTHIDNPNQIENISFTFKDEYTHY